ncbi:hypothetical protein F4692_001090 [Nocardioides cavernae]|uniref:Uncharacterized protein n=1 Tax=Nocardioides cavernae TaxID=1921566 RepID=A0A7Y9H1M3_9ACTN|nr:hypothetical protein [Nocardioides cavernae]NYE35986.1 hypothetical protein [Nocardioides cavernae]
MTTQIDWQHEIDSAFGSGDDRPVGHYVAAGQRAVRRRRRVALGGALAAAAVVAGVAWGAAPGSGPTRSQAPPVATDPSVTTEDAADGWPADEPPARFFGGGVEVREGAVVHDRRDDLYPGKGTDSAALDVSYGGERWWVAVEWGGDGAASNAVRSDEGLFASFDAFVAEKIRGGGMIYRPEPPENGAGDWLGGLVQWDGRKLTGRRGVEVVRTVQDPVGDGASIGVVLSRNGTTTWMLVTDGGGGASWTEEAGSGWPTFEEWLADQVATVEGDEAPTPVRLDGITVVGALAGVEVLDQQADPDLRAYGTAAAGTRSAVASIEWKDRRWFVLVIDDSVTTVAADKAGGASTLDDFVAFMADRADVGGMR